MIAHVASLGEVIANLPAYKTVRRRTASTALEKRFVHDEWLLRSSSSHLLACRRCKARPSWFSFAMASLPAFSCSWCATTCGNYALVQRMMCRTRAACLLTLVKVSACEVASLLPSPRPHCDAPLPGASSTAPKNVNVLQEQARQLDGTALQQCTDSSVVQEVRVWVEGNDVWYAAHQCSPNTFRQAHHALISRILLCVADVDRVMPEMGGRVMRRSIASKAAKPRSCSRMCASTSKQTTCSLQGGLASTTSQGEAICRLWHRCTLCCRIAAAATAAAAAAPCVQPALRA